jgi:16S rRNA (cytidine1402-2'-O)-methyltransferase
VSSSKTNGTLFIVSTPIGNLGDITFRAIETLKSVAMIAAEDTRQTRKLLNHYELSTPMMSYFEHNRFAQIPKIIAKLQSGESVAVVSDAGTPGISDPAYRLIREAIDKEIRVEPIPGASASISALVVSGLPTDRFLFEGFLPPKKGRKARIEKMKNETATIILYESPYRLVKTLSQLEEILGNRPAVVARELTKMFEEIKRGTLSDLISYFSQSKPKGECVILLGKDHTNVYF